MAKNNGLSADQLSSDTGFRRLVQLARKEKIELFLGMSCLEPAGISLPKLVHTLKAEAEAIGGDIESEAAFPRVAEEFLKRFDDDRSLLIEMLRREFEAARRRNPPEKIGIFRLIANIPQINKRVVTTYWGSYLKPVLNASGQSADEISQDDHISRINARDSAIIKLFGQLDNDSNLILTEADLSRLEGSESERAHQLWEYVKTRMDQSHCLFIGYQPNSFDFRLFREWLKAREDRKLHFFVAPVSDDARGFIENSGMKVIPATATEFLIALFRRLAEFANREAELNDIFGAATPFFEFHGHFGSGKSALLDEAVARAKAQGWTAGQIVRASDLEELRKGIAGQNRVFLTLDNTEAFLEEDQLDDLMELVVQQVAPEVEYLNRENTSRLLLAGRHPLMSKWSEPIKERYRFQHDLDSRRLKPLEKEHVREMIHKFFLARYPDTELWPVPDELLNEVLEVTQGHVGFVKDVLEKLVDKVGKDGIADRSEEEDLRADMRECLDQFSAKIDEEIPLGRVGKEFEERLCVFRLLITEIIEDLNIAEVVGAENSHGVMQKLWSSRILDPTDNKTDRVIRGVKAQALRAEKPTIYVETHEEARSLFWEYMKESVSAESSKKYFTEWLFHSLHLLIAEEVPPSEAGSQVRAAINTLPWDDEATRSDNGIGNRLVNTIIRDDHELWDLMQRCLGEEERTEILHLLEQK